MWIGAWGAIVVENGACGVAVLGRFLILELIAYFRTMIFWKYYLHHTHMQNSTANRPTNWQSKS